MLSIWQNGAPAAGAAQTSITAPEQLSGDLQQQLKLLPGQLLPASGRTHVSAVAAPAQCFCKFKLTRLKPSALVKACYST